MSDISGLTTGTGTSRPKKYVCDCPDCDKAYAKPSLLEQHKRIHTNERPFKCSYPDCNKSFLRKSHLLAHEVSHVDQKTKPFHCSICGKGVNSRQHLKRHEITHEKSFKCHYDGCDMSFYKHQSLRHHILSFHEKSLTCDKCNKTFARPYRLAQHKIKYHSEAPTYQCDYKGCFKNFKTWSALQLHVKHDHPRLKCDICDKRCVGLQGLMSHRASHDEEKTVKLWNCNYCTMGQFVKKIDLIKHYHEFHDGNLPDNLLDAEERRKLDELAGDTGDIWTKSNLVFGNGEDRNVDGNDNDIDNDSDNKSNIDDTYPNSENHTPINKGPSSLKSLNTLNSDLSQGKDILDLFLRNYETKKLSCPKPKCDRKFTHDHNLKKHLKWHEEHLNRINNYLTSLKDENDSDENDDEIMNEMIDDELKNLQNQSVVK